MFEKASKSFSFVKKFKLFAIISVIICAVGLGGLILQMFGVPVFNMGLDFVGGVTMEIELGAEVDRDVQEEIESIFEELSGTAASVTTSGNSGTAVTVKTTEISSEQREEIFAAVKARFSEASLISTDFVSASVGNDLKRSALIALSLAAVLILAYITIRFEFKSGIAAILCLIHDVLAILCFFILFRIQINMTFIAAALTIIGYSINATIVVFDRIRENKSRTGESFETVVDMSIWQSMRRSIGTTITTMLPVIIILVMGVSSIRVFAIPLLVGIIAGGYSSTCLAGPLWNLLKGK